MKFGLKYSAFELKFIYGLIIILYFNGEFRFGFGAVMAGLQRDYFREKF